MSEFHPNRTKQIRTRPKLTARKIFECWPLLVWAGILCVAYLLYRGGVQFTRMNGAVDVYQENIAPIHDGRLVKIHFKRGDRVKPGTVLAEIDAAPYRLELESLKRDIVVDRMKDIRDYDGEILKLENEMRSVQTDEARDSAVISELTAYKTAQEEAAIAWAKKYPGAPAPGVDTRILVDLAKATGGMPTHVEHRSKISESLDRVTKLRDALQAQQKIAETFDVVKDDLAKLAPSLRADEYQKFVETNTKIELCQLKTDRGGIVDRIGKEVGEYVRIGEGVLKIVGDPEHIVCFLPQDQAEDLKEGQKVYVVSTADKSSLYESTVSKVAPRINNLPDSTSPLPNRRVHGRDVLVDYPDSARNGDGTFKLLPGQTVIIHTSKPGEINLLDAIFHNDDNDKVR